MPVEHNNREMPPPLHVDENREQEATPSSIHFHRDAKKKSNGFSSFPQVTHDRRLAELRYVLGVLIIFVELGIVSPLLDSAGVAVVLIRLFGHPLRRYLMHLH